MEWADKKKASWQVFKYMDSNLSEEFTSASLSVIGIENWADVIEGYSPSFYTKYQVMRGELKQYGGYKKAASVKAKWKKYGASKDLKKSKKAWTVTRDSRRNKNCLWGLTQNFRKKISFAKHPLFYATVCVKGAKNKKAVVRIRFFSGKNVFECAGVVRCKKKVKLGVSLADWKYKNQVKKIQILVEPAGSSWKSRSTLTVGKIVRGDP